MNDQSDQHHLVVALQASEARHAALRTTIQRQNRDANILDQIRTLFAYELDLPTVFRVAVEKIATMFGDTHVSLYGYDGNTLTLRHQVGSPMISQIAINSGVMEQVVQTGEPMYVENDHIDPDALGTTPGVVAEICVPLLDQHAVVGVLNLASTHHDTLTKNDFRLLIAMSDQVNIALSRARLHAAVQESEHRYRDLVELSPDAIGLYSEGIVVYINQAGVTLLGGTSSSDIVGRSVLSFVPAANRPLVEQRMDQMQEPDQQVDLVEEQLVRLDGTTVAVEITGTPIMYAGKLTIQLVVRDVTERKRAEHQRLLTERRLLESQKMESLGVLAGGIAHDFNNLLLAIVGNASLALLDVPDDAPAHDPLRHIVAISQRATNLTQQMLAYSGKGHFVVQPIGINAIIADVQPLLVTALPINVALDLQLAPDLPMVEADVVQMRQVITNLVINAVESIDRPNGRIIIRTRLHHVPTVQPTQAHNVAPGKYVSLEIIDNGAGIEPAILPRIFDPFFTTKFTGRGLGLAVVLGIVRGHKGGINVESQPQQETCFTIFLPPHQDAAKTPSLPPAFQNAPRGEGYILVVDDEAMIRSVTERVLKRLGYKVLLAADGVEGLQLFRDHCEQIDCVLLDLTMPRMNGEEMFQAVQGIKPQARVIMMSGYTEEDATNQIGMRGLAGFLQKPFTINELSAKITAILSPST